ncbi:M10 family metallopeptidase C-terminal domain-containing protein [Paracoccus nototheniae]|uniref:M10 family metallopeptidase C-terminal domain-containing protein n=1 Tax=Paracoccus nototheniae TaxID=2489002 RepID=A0ABW4E172_9RHOB|nr:M10 family metallopeptidase C-terminal domain-containing protein [Paracoccus nototheniae]
MCQICAALRPMEKTCALSEFTGTAVDRLAATLREAGDAPDNTRTPYRMGPDDVFRGIIASGSDEDWVGIRLEAGTTYQIAVTGDALSDPMLALYDGSGRLLAANDDINASLDSGLTFRAQVTGTYFLGASGYGGQTGSYHMTAQELAPARPASTLELARYLHEGFWRDNWQEARAFDLSGDREITVNLTQLDPDGRALARDALAAWSAVADIRFRETNQTADIQFDDENSGAYAQSTTQDGRILSSAINIDRGWLSDYGAAIGTYGFQTYLHEVGHAIGLGHQGNYNGSGSFAMDARFANDSWQASVMSYFGQDENPNVTASQAFVATLMPADIMAIQMLYGAPGAGSLSAGSTTYGVGHTLGDSWLGRVFTAQGSVGVAGVRDARSVAMTIHDRDGFDVLDFRNDAQSQRVDLRPGGVSDIYGLTGNLQITQGTQIEGFVAGAGNDVVTGNGVGNLLRGGAGRDVLTGMTGNDSLHGERGHDTLWGGAGHDWLFGGDGDDQLSDMIGNNLLSGGAGQDRLIAGAGRDTLQGDAGHDLLDGGAGDDLIFGGIGADTILAGPGNDTAHGGWGHDVMNGGFGWDRLIGGLGNDALDGALGNDTLEGNEGNDLLRGGAGADLLSGHQGNDTLVGGMGSDTMAGGIGADVFRFFSVADSARGAGDLIIDFDPLADRLDLQAMDLRFGGRGAPSGPGSISWDHVGGQTHVTVDLDGDRQADMVIRLAGTLMLEADTFVL